MAINFLKIIPMKRLRKVRKEEGLVTPLPFSPISISTRGTS